MQAKKFLNNFKSRLFSINNLDKISTREPTPELSIETTPEVAKEPMNEIIYEWNYN